ncbi:lipopolysaccharide assembly LapA domain-containing protein [Pseudonocardia hispaniensis]|uniref:Lipopolysaccharide assembly LapA domain-containing protein n=1 Tax=Pseudonocardia hispaniensis TaxID=904933 RepID=A0ABW1IY87_9PSEU
MGDDRSRPAKAGPVRPGNVGQADPTADPVTDPALPRMGVGDPADEPTVPVPTEPAPRPGGGVATAKPDRTRVGGLWIGLILSALVLLFLLIFILQNLDPIRISFLGASGSLPTGVALLLAAIAGVLLVAIPGTGRIVQLRRTTRRAGSGRVR